MFFKKNKTSYDELKYIIGSTKLNDDSKKDLLFHFMDTKNPLNLENFNEIMGVISPEMDYSWQVLVTTFLENNKAEWKDAIKLLVKFIPAHDHSNIDCLRKEVEKIFVQNHQIQFEDALNFLVALVIDENILLCLLLNFFNRNKNNTDFNDIKNIMKKVHFEKMKEDEKNLILYNVLHNENLKVSPLESLDLLDIVIGGDDCIRTILDFIEHRTVNMQQTEFIKVLSKIKIISSQYRLIDLLGRFLSHGICVNYFNIISEMLKIFSEAEDSFKHEIMNTFIQHPVVKLAYEEFVACSMQCCFEDGMYQKILFADFLKQNNVGFDSFIGQLKNIEPTELKCDIVVNFLNASKTSITYEEFTKLNSICDFKDSKYMAQIFGAFLYKGKIDFELFIEQIETLKSEDNKIHPTIAFLNSNKISYNNLEILLKKINCVDKKNVIATISCFLRNNEIPFDSFLKICGYVDPITSDEKAELLSDFFKKNKIDFKLAIDQIKNLETKETKSFVTEAFLSNNELSFSDFKKLLTEAEITHKKHTVPICKIFLSKNKATVDEFLEICKFVESIDNYDKYGLLCNFLEKTKNTTMDDLVRIVTNRTMISLRNDNDYTWKLFTIVKIENKQEIPTKLEEFSKGIFPFSEAMHVEFIKKAIDNKLINSSNFNQINFSKISDDDLVLDLIELAIKRDCVPANNELAVFNLVKSRSHTMYDSIVEPCKNIDLENCFTKEGITQLENLFGKGNMKGMEFMDILSYYDMKKNIVGFSDILLPAFKEKISINLESSCKTLVLKPEQMEKLILLVGSGHSENLKSKFILNAKMCDYILSKVNIPILSMKEREQYEIDFTDSIFWDKTEQEELAKYFMTIYVPEQSNLEEVKTFLELF